MNYELKYHREAQAFINDSSEHPKIREDYNEIISTLDSISEEDLINGFNERKYGSANVNNKIFNEPKSQRVDIKSLSEPINFIFKDRMIDKGWTPESPIFYDKEYGQGQGSKKWRLDFAKNDISIEVAFNNTGAVAHNIIKPVLASQPNHVKKSINTKLGVIITASEESIATSKRLKNEEIHSGFDQGIGRLNKFLTYLKPYHFIVTEPLIFIGLKPQKTFKIIQDKDELGKKIKKRWHIEKI
jgi:hypothetical protein